MAMPFTWIAVQVNGIMLDLECNPFQAKAKSLFLNKEKYEYKQ